MCMKEDCGCFRIDHWQEGHVSLGLCTSPQCKKRLQHPSTLDCYMAPGVCCEGCGQYWVPEEVTDETLAAMAAEFKARSIRPADNAFGKRVPQAA